LIEYFAVAVSVSPLGFVAFGGPSAHIALLRDTFVVQRQMVDEEQFQELFAIGQVRFEQNTESPCSFILHYFGSLV
jgi:chromate transport protein ChrA